MKKSENERYSVEKIKFNEYENFIKSADTIRILFIFGLKDNDKIEVMYVKILDTKNYYPESFCQKVLPPVEKYLKEQNFHELVFKRCIILN